MKVKSAFVCQQCNYETPQWYGKCPSCGSWNSMVETVKSDPRAAQSRYAPSGPAAKPVRLSEVRHIEKNRLKSEYKEFDRVMGGGIVPGSVTLLSGDPGVGKSTLLLHILSKIGGLYVTAEESSEQVKLRAQRLGIKGDNIQIVSETNLENIISGFQEVKPLTLVIIDSIQTIASPDLNGMAGSVGQVRQCAESLIEYAKRYGVPILIIGHVTKEGTIAGPKTLEHMVDTVLFLAGEKFANARILKTLKNRYGATEEVGIFEMNDTGLKEIENPSKLFLQDRVQYVSGSVITVLLEGTRAILVEIQALVVPTQLAVPRRVANGFDFNRLQLIGAILQKRLNMPLGGFDIFINVSGGIRVTDPSADLAVVTAIISSFKNKPVGPKSVFLGEVGLLGEIRQVGQLEIRRKEASRLGFTDIIDPTHTKNLSILEKKYFS